MEDTTNGDDAQRTLEQRALKNVRGLVDNLQDAEAAQARLQKRILVGFAIAIVLGILVYSSGVFTRGAEPGTVITVAPPAAKK
jgi:hypothetical protein